jgi:propionate catabolism operon transcriptional regulator
MSPALIFQLPLGPVMQKKLLEIAQKNLPLYVWGPLGSEKETLAYTWYQMKHRMGYPFQTILCHESLLVSDFPIINLEKVFYFHNIERLPLTLQENLAQQLRKNASAINHVAISSALPLPALTAPGLFSKTLADFFTQGLEIPSLLSRSAEIPDILEKLRNQINLRYGLNITGLHSEALTVLSWHEWAGNLAELLAVFEGICLRKKSGEIDVTDLPLPIIAPQIPHLQPRSLNTFLTHAQA